MSKTLLIFDLDGTLVDSGIDIANAINHTKVALGQEPYSRETILSFVGNGFENLLQRAVAIAPQDTQTVQHARGIFTEYYLEHLLDNTRVYPNMLEALHLLPHKQKVIITNKRKLFAEIIVDKLGLSSFFCEIICGDSFSYMKPDARLLTITAERYDASCSKTTVIGDGTSDILLARNGGGVSCAHLVGLTKRELLLSLQPDIVYEDPLELVRLLG